MNDAGCHARTTSVPARGAVFLGSDVAGRALRVSAHPELGRVVVSVWQHERCVATVRLAESDVPDLVRALTEALLPDGVAESRPRTAS